MLRPYSAQLELNSKSLKKNEWLADVIVSRYIELLDTKIRMAQQKPFNFAMFIAYPFKAKAYNDGHVRNISN